MKGLRAFLERIAFAGLKPDGGKPLGPQAKKPGGLSAAIERFLAKGASSDPLYLSNRSTNEKMRSWALVGIPCLVLVIAIGVATNFLDPPEAKPLKELSAKEVAAKMLPNMQQDFKLASNTDVQVTEIAVQHVGGDRLTGIVHNSTDREIRIVDLIIDLTDTSGSQVGGVSGSVEKIPAKSNKQFQFPIKQKDAAIALVRDISSR